VGLSAPTNATLATASVTTSIADDGTGSGGTNDDTPALAVSTGNVLEGAAAVFTVSLSNPSTSPVVFTPSLASGTATVGTDTGALAALEVSTDGGTTWSPVAGNVTIPAGATSVLLRLPTVDDALSEAAETFSLTATPVSGAQPTPASAVATIIDNDGAPSLFVNDISVNEDAGTATFTVTLSNPSASPVTVGYSTADGTAVAPGDYTAGSGTLTFAPGVTSQTVTVPIANDTLDEADETFTVTLSAPTNATLADATGIGTIVDDDAAPAVASVSSPTTAEGTDLVYTVTLTNGSASAVSFPFSLGGGSASASDYGAPTFSNGVTLAGGVLTVPPGVTSFTVTLPTTPDTLDEPNETVPLSVGGVSGTGTITDDDPTPTLSIDDVSVNEASGTATFTVTLSAASGRTVSVNYTTSDGTATAGSDYAAASGTLTFAPGVTSQTITVSISNDTVFEGNETFNVLLGGFVVNATIADGTGIGTIIDDDSAPTVASVSAASVTEGGTLVHTITLSNASATATTFPFSLAGTTATAGSDFSTTPSFSNGVTLSGGVITVPVGVTSFTASYNTVDDALDEFDETTSLTVGGVTAVGTINDNDPTPTLSIDDVTVNEAAGTATFTVTLSAASGQTVTVNYATANGTATAGSDYTAASGTLTFAPGVTTQTVTVSILNDVVTESSETFNVNLSGAVNATIADGLGVGTIIDNDAPPVLDLDANNSSGTAGANFTTSYTENAVPVSIGDADVSITDIDSTTLTGATITLTNAQAGDVLTAGTMPSGITASVVGNVVTLSGIGSLADYQTAIRAITFANASENPNTTPRNITVVVRDGTLTSNTATTTINVVAVNDAPTIGPASASVSEEGLPGGQPDTSGTVDTTDSAVVTGTIPITDVDGPSTTVTLMAPAPGLTASGFAVTWSGSGTNTLTATANGQTVATLTVDNAGQYTFTLLEPVDHAGLNVEDVRTLDFGVTVSDGSLNASSTLTINIEDDAPPALPPITETLAITNTNLMIVLDVSGSMGTLDGVNGTSRLASAVTSINRLLDSYAEFGDVRVRLITFSTNAAAQGNVWTDIATAKAQLAALTAGGGTNYDEALGDAITAYASSGKLAGAQNISYFFSDGLPTFGSGTTNELTPPGQSPGTPATNGTGNSQTGSDTGIQPAEEAIWTNFVATNNINSFAVGFGAGITDVTYLNPIAYDGQTGTNTNGILVSNFNDLDRTLAETLPATSASGEFTTSGSLFSGSAFGGDGGHVRTITVEGTTYTYDPAGDGSVAASGGPNRGSFDTVTNTLTVTTTAGGTFVVGLDTGTYVYNRPSAGVTTSLVETMSFTLADKDGDTTSSSLTANFRQAVVTYGTGGADTINGTADPDIISAGGGDDTVNGLAGNDALYGQDGNDTLNGDDGNDALYGGAGTDVLNGGTGNDLLEGGAGNDTLNGGAGVDTYTWSAGDKGVAGAPAVDTITDFAAGSGGEVLDLRALLIGEKASGSGANLQRYLDLDFTSIPGSTVIRVSTTGGYNVAGDYNAAVHDQSIILNGVDLRTALPGLPPSPTEADVLQRLLDLGQLITDGRPTRVLIDDVTVNEGAGTATFTVRLTNPTDLTVTVGYATSNGTATAGSDYTATSGTLTFAPGVTSQTVTVAITNDTPFESAETFNVNLTTVTEATIADNLGIGTIRDDGTGAGGTDNDAPVLSIGNVTVAENVAGGYAVFTVSLSKTSPLATTVDFGITPGTAGAADYILAGMQVSTDNGTTWVNGMSATFVPGQTTNVRVRVPIVNDTLDEASETFTLTGTTSAGVTANASASATTTITDDDPTPSLTVNDLAVDEAAGTATFTVTLSAPSGQTVTVGYNTSNGSATAGSDYTATSGTLTFAPGVTTQTVTVTIAEDAVDEANETFNVNLVTPTNATIADNLGVGTITDNDAPPTITINDLVVNEATGNAVLTVSLSSASGQTVTVNYATGNGTALAGSDYDSRSGTLTFAPGTLTQTITIPITNDNPYELAETFNVNLTGATNAVIADNLGVVTIRDDGTGSGGTNDDRPNLTVNSFNVAENVAGGYAVFTVSLSKASGVATTVDFAATPGTAGAGDFNAAGMQVSTDGGATWVNATSATFAPGQTNNVRVRIPVINDLLDEIDETFSLVATARDGTTLNASATGTATIRDNNDPAPTLAVSPVVVAETAGFAVFNVTLSVPSGIPIGVNLSTADSTATTPADYTTALQVSTDGGSTWTVGSSATFAPEATSVLVRVPIVADGTAEPNQTFTLTATRSSGATTNGNASGTATITESTTLTGGTGNDTLTGGSAAETLNGGDGNDIIFGGAGDDAVNGGNGADRLYGGAGSDTLTGGAGADIFAWTLADRGTPGAGPLDTIVDFDNAAGGDVLDLRDLLQGESSGNLASYLHFTTSGGNTTISVSSTGGFAGGFAGGAVDQVIQISGVDLVGGFTSDSQVIADLLSRGKLVVDA
jgi:T1SS-143 domain-containing protein